MAKDKDNTPSNEDSPDPRVTKRRVTMRNAVLDPSGVLVTTEALDYVRPDFLDAYVADARTRWQYVEVGPRDAGPGGYEGQTVVPRGLNHPLAGRVFEAISKED